MLLLQGLLKTFQRTSLALRFSLASFFIFAAGTIVIGQWTGEKIKTSIINKTAATTALYLDNFISPNIQELAHTDSISAEHLANLDRVLHETQLGHEIVTIKVWGPNGKVLYSTNPSLIGRIFPDGEDLAQARKGGVVSDISDLQDAENVEERRFFKRLLEIYVPVRLVGTEQIIAVAEFYTRVDRLEAEIANAQQESWIAISVGMAIVYLMLVGFISRATQRIRRQGAALQNQIAQLTEVLAHNDELDLRIRRASENTATLNENFLRRVSMDLNTGPVQEISVSLQQLEQTLKGSLICQLPDSSGRCHDNLPAILRSVETALGEVQFIATGLGLPQLENLTLLETVARAVQAHEERTNTRVILQTGPLPELVTLPINIVAYRLIQEGLSNAHRHAGGVGQEIHVTAESDAIKIVIIDKGPGFDTSRPIEWSEHLGLAGMQERVKSLGGLFTVVSKIGTGTNITALLPLHRNSEVTSV